MKNILLALLLSNCLYACNSSKKSQIKKSIYSFNEFQKNKDAKLMFQTGIDFFAEGNLPTNWNMKMDYDDTVRFSAEDGLSINIAYNELKKDIKVDTNVFSAKIKAGDIIITTLESNCSISSNKYIFNKQVQFNFNNNVYFGCGKFLADNTLNNKWILEKIENNLINAKDYNRLPVFNIDIEKMSLSGNDGCNILQGKIEVQGSRIKFGNITTKEMGCNKKSIRSIISNLINNNVVSYYFKEGKLYLYLINDSLLVFKTG
jgi:heat shock protein HslJ